MPFRRKSPGSICFPNRMRLDENFLLVNRSRISLLVKEGRVEEAPPVLVVSFAEACARTGAAVG